MSNFANFYAIGASLGTLQTMAELGLVEPFQDAYAPFSVEVDAGDLMVYGHGLASTAWRWGFLSQAHRDLLKAYCPGKSATVYIRLRDDNWEWCICKAVMVWQQENPPISGFVPELILGFRILENYGATAP